MIEDETAATIAEIRVQEDNTRSTVVEQVQALSDNLTQTINNDGAATRAHITA